MARHEQNVGEHAWGAYGGSRKIVRASIVREVVLADDGTSILSRKFESIHLHTDNGKTVVHLAIVDAAALGNALLEAARVAGLESGSRRG